MPGRKKTVTTILGEQLDELKALEARKAALLTEMGLPSVPPPTLEDRVFQMTVELQSSLAQLAQNKGCDRLLAAARIVDGLRSCLETAPAGQGTVAMAKEMGIVARRLVLAAQKAGSKVASFYPKAIRAYGPAAAELSRVVEIEAQYAPPNGTPEGLAAALEMLRMTYKFLGTERVLPHQGTSEERVLVFTDAIRRLRENTDADRPLDGEAIVMSCARRCGNKKELFGSLRQAEKRRANK